MSEYIERLIHFTGLRVRPLDGGGVYLNVGRARKDVTTVNFDFLDHYRPRVNVVGRPHLDAGGPGIGLRGHQELRLPLVAAALLEREP